MEARTKMEATEKIQTIIDTIQGLDQITVNKWEERNKIITIEEASDYEDWETTELKDTLYQQLGKLYYDNNSNITTQE